MKNIIFILLLSLFVINNAEAQDSNRSDNRGAKPFMGVTLGTSWGDGVEINQISKNYGAERAGLQEGDIITAINNDKIRNGSEFTKTLRKYRPSEEVEVSFLRGKDKKTAKVKLAESPNSESWSFGIDSDDMEEAREELDDVVIALRKSADVIRREVNESFTLNEKARLGIYPETNWEKKAVKITGFTKNSPAKKAGLEKDDLITSINKEEINTEEELRYALKALKPKDEIEVTYIRNGKSNVAKVVLTNDSEKDDNNSGGYYGDSEGWGSSYSKKEQNNETRTWSSYTFADGTQVDLNDFKVSPTKDDVNISFESKLNQPFSVVLYDDNGKEVVREEMTKLEGKFEKKFDLKNSKGNSFFVKLWISGKEAFSQKISLQR